MKNIIFSYLATVALAFILQAVGYWAVYWVLKVKGFPYLTSRY